MKAEFKPIAMRCNQQQFEVIKPKLEKFAHKIVGYNFKKYDYLVNNANDVKLYIENFDKHDIKNYNRTVYETWDEATFLRCCGIEVEETFTVSKEFILELHNEIVWPSVKAKIEKQFPQLFESKLEAGKWYKKIWEDGDIDLFFYEKQDVEYVFFGENYFRNGKRLIQTTYRNNLKDMLSDNRITISEATESEVKTALIAEAEKRGFKEGVNVKDFSKINEIITLSNSYCHFYFTDNDMYMGGACIFDNGKWATIIKNPIEMTVAEIEAKLGHSVKIVK